jgi:MFS family permease
VTTAAGAGYNLQQVALLSNPTYFDVPVAEQGRTQSKILFYGTIVSIIASIFVGYTFDLFGRKGPIAVAFALMIFLVWSLPYVSTIPLLILNRALIQVAFQYLHSHPLIIDYIKSESRGRATSMQALGNGLGEFIAMTVFLSI